MRALAPRKRAGDRLGESHCAGGARQNTPGRSPGYDPTELQTCSQTGPARHAGHQHPIGGGRFHHLAQPQAASLRPRFPAWLCGRHSAPSQSLPQHRYAAGPFGFQPQCFSMNMRNSPAEVELHTSPQSRHANACSVSLVPPRRVNAKERRPSGWNTAGSRAASILPLTTMSLRQLRHWFMGSGIACDSATGAG